MSLDQINEIRDSAAKRNGAKDIAGPWKDHFIEMGRKTVIRRLAKYLPLSIEFQRATALDEAGDSGAEVGSVEGEFTVEYGNEEDSNVEFDIETGEINKESQDSGLVLK